ncbi:MAG TPA: YkvA family protein [Mycobacteriales bacterium]|nr:YkvA family protein [Mycobacteriales bacterium]
MDKERVRALAREAATFVPDVARLFRDVARDDRVPRRVKVEVGLAAGYLVLPIDLIPDFIPGLGQLDDIAIMGWAIRRLLLGAGENILREHWHGTDRGLEVLLQVASIGFHPRRLLAGLALGGLAGRAGERSDVVEGEVLGTRPADHRP